MLAKHTDYTQKWAGWQAKAAVLEQRESSFFLWKRELTHSRYLKPHC